MSERIHDLLLKAVGALEPQERDEVLSELLASGAALVATQRLMDVSHTTDARTRTMALRDELSATLGAASGEVKMLPVRLPTADYDRLRAFSREHGFSMAVIIRTLVERFLDNEAGRPVAPR
jgi:hypothetical protein